eukprot:COSAG05_NODE_13841_length_416_cov_1.703470_2_plen_23_part_01
MISDQRHDFAETEQDSPKFCFNN